MQVIYSGEYTDVKTNPTIFLAGCSPRKGQTLNWRKEAIDYLQLQGFKGTVIVPEPRNGQWNDYLDVVGWETEYLELATKILFWVPRNMENKIYGLSTNVEFGIWLSSGKIVYGRPDDADNIRYLDYQYQRHTGKQPHNHLFNLLNEIL